MSAAKKGKPPLNKGKPASAAARLKQSIAAKQRWKRMGDDERRRYQERLHALIPPEKRSHPGWKHTDEARAKIAAANHDRKTTNKLNKEQALQVVALRGDGASLKRLAEQFNVSVQAISNLLHGRTYADWTGIELWCRNKRRTPKYG